MEDVAKYVDRLIVMNQGEVRFDGRPVEVFHHYKELEEIGLAAPQTTYLMQAIEKTRCRCKYRCDNGGRGSRCHRSLAESIQVGDLP